MKIVTEDFNWSNAKRLYEEGYHFYINTTDGKVCFKELGEAEKYADQHNKEVEEIW